ncbi:MAG: hypothetical protein A2Y64_09225 [Candidatus Coatesbacteria bacterium RBG_13_66_14]|uniref:DUF4878 domain-containing protein n=1 Tax=Candidatus Coatesbacteria bacterium RBG_13_66_14 TaxID=1817816 RepID=A0A1F5FIU5_9BACT|nr:MAG: hypothetical protein A2Y64_09225 [Candidatus Coatesbacteria bacterium RBG_13_66_14]
MKKVILSVFAVLLFTLACGETGSPEGTVVRLLEALKDADREAALATLYSGSEESDAPEQLDKIWGDVESGKVVLLSWTDPKVGEKEEVSEEGVDVLEYAEVGAVLTLGFGDERVEEEVGFEVVRTDQGWSIFNMD